MTKRIAFACLGLCLLALPTQADDPPAWSEWRGNYATGSAPDADPPTEWSETKNVRWKTAIPGKGHASPIVWGDRVFVLTAIETGEAADEPEAEPKPPRRRRRGRRNGNWKKVRDFAILALDRRSGEVVWQRSVRKETPHETVHRDGTWASNSPICDGERVYALFGSRGLHCLDMDGKPLWEKDLGKMTIRMQFGEGSSPALHGDTIVVNWDHEHQSFIVAFDKKTGKELWKVDRDEPTSWSTPLIVEVEGRTQVITSATNRVRAYDLADGSLIWECAGMTGNVVPCPIYSDGLVYLTSGFRGNALLAVRLAGAEGDITGSDSIVWTLKKHTPYTPSPLVHKGLIYMLNRNNGILSCFDAKNGAEHFSRRRLQGVNVVYSSPIGTGDRIYVVGKNGTTLAIKHGPSGEILAKNTLEDEFCASPAVVKNEIFLRGAKYLYCIGREFR